MNQHIVVEEEGLWPLPEMLAFEAATSPPQRLRVRVSDRRCFCFVALVVNLTPFTIYVKMMNLVVPILRSSISWC